jgi:hypothetical protein
MGLRLVCFPVDLSDIDACRQAIVGGIVELLGGGTSSKFLSLHQLQMERAT